MFYIFYWRQFSKSWTSSFLPYPCSAPLLLLAFWLVFPTQFKASKSKVYQPLCVSFYYIIYSKCIYYYVKYSYMLHWRQFSKSWTPSFLPYPCSLMPTHFCYLISVLNQTTEMSSHINPPVCFFLLYYIYSKCMYFWVPRFAVSLTPIFKKLDAFIPALSLLLNLSFFLCFCFGTQQKHKKKDKESLPTPVCFFLLYYIYSKCMFFWVTCFCIFTDANFQKAGRLHSCLIMFRGYSFVLFFTCYYKNNTKE